jgi:hypothetical protein
MTATSSPSTLTVHVPMTFTMHVRAKLLPSIDSEISHWHSNYRGHESPSDYFATLRSTLEDFSKAFADEKLMVEFIESGFIKIDEAIAELGEDQRDDSDYRTYFRGTEGVSSTSNSRSIFDDVDE